MMIAYNYFQDQTLKNCATRITPWPEKVLKVSKPNIFRIFTQSVTKHN